MGQCYGSGKFVYDYVAGWPEPNGIAIIDVADVAVDRMDCVYLFCRQPNCVAVYDRDGRFLSKWGDDMFVRAHGITIGPEDTVFCVDDRGHNVRKFTLDGRLLLTVGTPGQPSDTGWAGDRATLRGGPPFNEQTNLSLAADGSFYVSDGYRNCRVHHFAPDGTLIRSWGTPGASPGQFSLVHGVCVGRDGSVYAGDRDHHRVERFSPDGEYMGEWTDLRSPDDIYLAPDGLFYVAEAGYLFDGEIAACGIMPRVTVRDASGAILAAWGDETGRAGTGPMGAPHGVCVDSRGDVYVADVGNTARAAYKDAKVHYPPIQKYLRVR